MIARGRYLASVNCELCHGKDLAGGKEFTLPVSHAYASNITPDKAAGIGSFTDGQLEEALRRGVAPDGRVLRPPMPVLDTMADEDLDAIIAYLGTVPAAGKPAPASELTLLGRFVLALGRYKPPKLATNVPAPKDAGRYLAESVLLCSECHHPRTKNVPIAGRLWAGGFLLEEPGLAPVLSANLTPDPVEGIGAWSRSDFTVALRQGKNPSGRALHEAMPRYPVTEDDAALVYDFLKTVPPVHEHVYTPEALHGEALYARTCQSCHGPDGKGPRADVTKLGKAGDVARLVEWIKDPAAVKPGTQMPNMGVTDPRDLDDLARFIVELSKR